MSAERLWAFNRRVVEDQTIFVRAATLGEAWAKARADQAEGTAEPTVRATTVRRTPEDDPTETGGQP